MPCEMKVHLEHTTWHGIIVTTVRT